MKRIILISTAGFLSMFITPFFGQTLKERILQNTKNTLERRAEEAVDKRLNKGVDKVEDSADDAVKNATKKKKKSKNEDNTNNNESNTSEQVTTDQDNPKSNDNSKTNKDNASLVVYSKFDFIPGEKIVASEDFSQDAVGDFPAKWNTNGSGEVVLLNNSSTKYLKTTSECVFYPEWVSNLPDNFTVEFDLVCTDKLSFYSGFFAVGFTSEKNIGKIFHKFSRFDKGNIDNGGGFEIGFHPESAGGTRGRTLVYSSFKGEKIMENEAEQDEFVVNKNKKNIHVSIWRQKGRVRVYFNEKKVWDLPRLCPETTINSIYFRNDGLNPENEAYFISNLRIAVGAPDTRSKLITEGKFSTTGIKFDSGSDKIKPESYPVLKEIANVLKENPNVRVKIIGHTDSDGSPDKNLELSKKRAISVKNALIKEFGIEDSRMETDGKGQTMPVDDNSTPQGKANNRRVEFVKL
ncbi:MAG TPA: OmpA family protein [Bacteroidia bacterium]|nr:OmpA family protein [Bacteroidia bacterium]